MRPRVKLEWLLAFAWFLPAALEMHGAASAFAQQGLETSSGPSAREGFGINYPDETNTGVPADLNLTPATRFRFDVAGATVSGLDFQGTVTIAAPNVTLRNFRITAKSWAALDIRADGVILENCEIDGQAAPGIRGISVSGHNVSIRRCDIHHVEDGIYLAGSSKIDIENNYIHDLQSRWDGPHFDGIATDGGISDVLIRGNTVINPHPQTSAIMLSNYFGPVSGVRVERNRLIGGGYTVYSDGQFNNGEISGVSFLNNRLGRGFYGYSSIQRNAPEWSGNVDDKRGTTVNQ
jgi:parallel beta-helix repeat protein